MSGKRWKIFFYSNNRPEKKFGQASEKRLLNDSNFRTEAMALKKKKLQAVTLNKDKDFYAKFQQAYFWPSL